MAEITIPTRKEKLCLGCGLVRRGVHVVEINNLSEMMKSNRVLFRHILTRRQHPWLHPHTLQTTLDWFRSWLIRHIQWDHQWWSRKEIRHWRWGYRWWWPTTLSPWKGSWHFFLPPSSCSHTVQGCEKNRWIMNRGNGSGLPEHEKLKLNRNTHHPDINVGELVEVLKQIF